MRRYIGTPPHNVVVVSDTPGVAAIPLPLRLDLENHSPTGFCWGYGGSGPAQLALALIADAVDDNMARRNYQQFKWEVIARFPMDQSWELTDEQVKDWVHLAEGQRFYAESKQ